MYKKAANRRTVEVLVTDADQENAADKKIEFNPSPIESLYSVGDQLGSGQFAVVKQCIQKSSGESFAVKFVHKRRTQSSRRGLDVKDILREAEILKELSHQNIVKLYDVHESPQDVILVLELVSGGELFQYLVNRSKVCETEAVSFLIQILQALKYMHERNIVHLDLKPENLVLGGQSNSIIKLIDFGLSQKIQPGKDLKGLQGTAEFVAPEVINYDPLSTGTDMWSLGVITYIMLSGCSPFLGDSNQETLANASSAQYDLDDESFSTTSGLAKDFISKLLVKIPEKRMSADDCIRHAWITPMDKKQEEYRRRSTINIVGLKSFIARKRWKISFTVVSLLSHLNKSVRLTRSQSDLIKTSSTSLANSSKTDDEKDQSEKSKKKSTSLVKKYSFLRFDKEIRSSSANRLKT